MTGTATHPGSVPLVSGRDSRTRADRWVAGVTGALALVTLGGFVVAGELAPAGTVRTPSVAGGLVAATLVVAQAATLLWRRTAPRSVLLATSLALTLSAAVGLGEALSALQLAVLVAAYTLGLAVPASRAWPAFALTALVLGVGSALVARDGGEPWGTALALGLFQGVGTVALPWLVAIVVAARRDVAQARASRTAALERERDALVQAAIARERTAMARELHDIAAHHLSGIAVMTAAIGTQIDTDPAAAKAGVAQVRQQSKAVLQDLRSLVGLLRDDREHTSHVRPESLAGIAGLVEEVTTAGRDVTLTVLDSSGGAPTGIGPLAQLAAYRMVQEALANAARHAPGSGVEVTVDASAAASVVVTVRNDPPASPTTGPSAVEAGRGFGLVGMRERAELTGATVDAGPTADGGWQVRLTMPREGP